MKRISSISAVIATIFISSYTFASDQEQTPVEGLKQPVLNGIPNLTLSNDTATLTQSLVAIDNEDSVQDLFYKYKIPGRNNEFWKGIEKLSDRQDPQAWNYWGSRLMISNLFERNKEFYEGITLLNLAAMAGVVQAYNTLGRLYHLFMGYKEAGLRYYRLGEDFPFCTANYGLALFEAEGFTPEVRRLLESAMDRGEAIGATGLFEALEKEKALKDQLAYALISYRGQTSMDRFWGLETILSFLRNSNFTKEEITLAREDAKKWFESHQGRLIDGFDQDMIGALTPQNIGKCNRPEIDRTSVQSLFWTTYAVKDIPSFNRELETFLSKGDANALYMAAHLCRGFFRYSDLHRAMYLKQATERLHPLASLEQAIEFLFEGLMSKNEDDLANAYQILLKAHNKWSATEYMADTADITAYLAYLTYEGIGCQANKDLALTYFQRVRFVSPMANTFLIKTIVDPIEACAYAIATEPNFTMGDDFFGFFTANSLKKNLSNEQKALASLKAVSIREEHPPLAYNIYQKMGNGLNPAFSGLN